MGKALEGIRVLELAHVVAGPWCGMQLANLGAEVIKVEKPGTGEHNRIYGSKKNGVALAYASYNMNKKCITMNLQAPEAKEIIYKLVKKVDIVIENQKPGMLKKIGLGYEDLKKQNPAIIMASISGYGQDGPYAKRLAYDMTVSAMSGIMSITGYPNDPMKPGMAIIDFLSGLYCTIGVLGALQYRNRTGEGQYVDISMLESAVSVLDQRLAVSIINDTDYTGTGNRIPIACPINTFKTKDGHIQISCNTDTQYFNLCKVMGRQDMLENPDYQESMARKAHEEAIEAEVNAWVGQYTNDEAAALLEAGGVPNAPIRTIKSLPSNPQLIARNAFVKFDQPGIGEYTMLGFVPKFSTIETPANRAPELGEHNKEVICGMLGYSEAEYQAFLDKKVM